MSTYHILIVDDQKDIRRVLVSGLQTLGQTLDVIEVPSAEEAMLLAPRRTFDLIVTDVRLPGISGLDLVKKLRAFNPKLKLILITGLSDHQTRKQVEEAGTFAFFYKPIEMGDFLDAVERALGLVETSFAPAPLVVETPKQQQTPAPAFEKVVVKPAQPAPLAPLAALREQLSVLAVLCMEESGQVVSQAGDFSEIGAQSVVLRALIGVAQANHKLSQSMSRPVPDYLLVLDGIGYHLCLAPVGLKHLLVLVGNQPFQNNVALAGGLVKAAAKDLLPLLVKPEPEIAELPEAPAPAPAMEVVPPFEPDAELLDALEQVEITEKDRKAIDELFAKKETVKVEVKNLDDFWDTVAEETGSLNLNEDHITFDQAKDLGLAPET